MIDHENFSAKITELLTRHRVELIKKQGSINEEMQVLLKRRESFAVEAGRVMRVVIVPRIREMTRHFSNVTVAEPSATDLSCTCSFAHVPRFPATVTLAVAIGSDESYEKLKLHYTLNILPEFIEYERSSDLRVALGTSSDQKAGHWVEEKLLQFLDTYLLLETHPVYQKDNLVTDPVCGMRLPLVEAVSSIMRGGREIYFCSQTCRDADLKENGTGEPREAGA